MIYGIFLLFEGYWRLWVTQGTGLRVELRVKGLGVTV